MISVFVIDEKHSDRILVGEFCQNRLTQIKILIRLQFNQLVNVSHA